MNLPVEGSVADKTQTIETPHTRLNPKAPEFIPEGMKFTASAPEVTPSFSAEEGLDASPLGFVPQQSFTAEPIQLKAPAKKSQIAAKSAVVPIKPPRKRNSPEFMAKIQEEEAGCALE